VQIIHFIFVISLSLVPANSDRVILTQSTPISDVCTAIPIGIALEDWMVPPEDVSELSTSEHFTYLAGQMIHNGIVDASTCPDGGVLSNGHASPCGLSAVIDLVVTWQNQFDNAIMDSSNHAHVSPRLLKGLFAQESQFWPGSKYGFEYGLGHITESGADTTLMWSPELYSQVCNQTIGNGCYDPDDYFAYSLEDHFDKKYLRVEILERVNADCQNCLGGVDLDKAQNSVELFSWALLAHCRQASQVIYEVTGFVPLVVMDYSSLWKVALFTYNTGAGCLMETLTASWDGDRVLGWEEFAGHSEGTCQSGVIFVEQVLNYADRMGSD